MAWRKTIVSVCLAVLFITADAQTFIKPFVEDSSPTLAYSLCIKDSFFFVAGGIIDTVIAGRAASYLAKFDYSGNQISNITLRNDQYIYFDLVSNQNALKPTADGGMAAVGRVQDTTLKYFVLFSKFDSAGNLQFYKTFDFGLSGYRHLNAFGLIQYGSAYFIIGDIQLANYYAEPILIKLDLAGNLIFAKTYNNLPETYAMRESICSLPDSNLLLCIGRSDANINYWQEIDKTCFLEVDTGGNLIHQYCTGDTNTLAYSNVAPTYDGKYLSCGQYYFDRLQGDGQFYKEYLAKWDTSFNRIWELNEGDLSSVNGFSDFEQNGQSDILLCGQNLNDSDEAAGYNGVLAKVSKDGVPVWYHKYKVPTNLNPDYSWNYLNDIALLPNGDILAVGSWESAFSTSPLYFQQVGWIIRVHSDGCMDDGTCGITGIDEAPAKTESMNMQKPVQVFPNPSNGIFTVNAMMDLPYASTLKVFDELGRQLLTQPLLHRVNLVNLYYLPNGIYFYKIGNDFVNVDEGKMVIQK